MRHENIKYIPKKGYEQDLRIKIFFEPQKGYFISLTKGFLNGETFIYQASKEKTYLIEAGRRFNRRKFDCFCENQQRYIKNE
jgi:hypothetical protein